MGRRDPKAVERKLKSFRLDEQKRARREAKKKRLKGSTEEKRQPHDSENNAAQHPEALSGQVITRARGGVLVKTDHGEKHWCRVPGKGSSLPPVVPGDRVLFNPSSDTTDGWLLEIHPRSSYLKRYQFGRIKEIVANLERIMILATPSDPTVSPRLVDRMLVGASIGGMEPVILLHKADLFQAVDLEKYSLPWVQAGYHVITASSDTGEGLHLVRLELEGSETLLAGPSGVGKSTLLNRLIEELDMDTSAISEATGRGVHTTTFTRLFPFPGGGIVADSPGVREFYPVLESTDELQEHFPEFQLHREECRYRDCLHLETDSGCAVEEAARTGAIHQDRLASYRILYRSLQEGPRRGRGPQQAPPLM